MKRIAAFTLVTGAALAVGCRQHAAPAPPPVWTPGTAYATPATPVYRGFFDRRGLIHSHNIHSHDACDGNPTDPDSGLPNTQCFADFREDYCKSMHDFVFMTDHPATFDTTEYPDTMLYEAGSGDQLQMRNGAPVANRLTCPDGRTPLIIPGTEGDNLMAVGLEQHVGDAGTRTAIYGTTTLPADFPGNTAVVTNTIQVEQANGAVVVVAHPEGLSQEQLATYPIDGFEMYNLHANALLTALSLIHI